VYVLVVVVVVVVCILYLSNKIHIISESVCLLTSTYIIMHQHIIKSSITSKSMYKLTHIDTTTTSNAEINAIISTELANDAL